MHDPEDRGRAERRSSALRSQSTAGGGEYRAAEARKTASDRLVCDKCDGNHETSKCPHFRKDREKHISAWENYGKKGVVAGNQEVTYAERDCRCVPQPGDGSCLYHSLSYGLGEQLVASKLRKEIADFVAKNPGLKIADTALSDWVKYDSGASASDYASKMMYGSRWGGGIEIAACAQLYKVDIHVYQRTSKGYTRISTFPQTNPRKTLNLLYEGNCHYNYIEISGR
jgi:hypothetical protein